MKKIASILLVACLMFCSAAQAQRTIKSVKFGDYSMNTDPDSFIRKLEKNGWKTSTIINGTDSQGRSYSKTTLEGRINGIEVSATVVPSEDLEKVAQIIVFTDADQALNKTRYDVIKSWLTNLYEEPAVEDLELEDGNISCYWGDFKKGDRDLQKNHISLTTVENQYTVVTLNNQENALDATMNNIGDAIEGFGDKVHKTGQKAAEKGKKIKEKVKEKGQQIGDKITGAAENVADKTADERQAVGDFAKDRAGRVSKKAKRIAQSAANGAKKAWESVKDTVKKKD